MQRNVCEYILGVFIYKVVIKDDLYEPLVLLLDTYSLSRHHLILKRI